GAAGCPDCVAFFFSSRRRHTRFSRDWSSDVCSSDLAGGVVGAARTSEQAGFSRVIGFDMGGTSTDVAHYNGEYERAFETEVAGRSEERRVGKEGRSRTSR